MDVEESNKILHTISVNIDDLLQYKNTKYNGSIDKPIHVFSQLSPEEGIKQRIDDKLCRIKEGEIKKNDVVDLIGYLEHLCKEKGWITFEEFKD